MQEEYAVALALLGIFLLTVGLFVAHLSRTGVGGGSAQGSRESSKTPAVESASVAVPRLKDEEFLGKLDTEDADTCVVMVYAAWCGHSRKALPAFEAAAECAEATPFYLLDEKVCPQTIKTYEVRGFPTIFRFDRGALKPASYQGDRTAASIVAFAQAGVK